MNRLGVGAAILSLGSWLCAGCLESSDRETSETDAAEDLPEDGGPGDALIHPDEVADPIEDVGQDLNRPDGSCLYVAGEKIRSDCGDFVDPSVSYPATHHPAGTKDDPFRTLGELLAVRKDDAIRHIYVCGESLEESLTIAQSARIFGGVSCATGRFTEARTRWQNVGGRPNLKTDEIDLELHGFDIVAAPKDEPSASAIAVVLHGGHAGFFRSSVTAERGMDGAPGLSAEPAEIGEIGGDGAIAVDGEVALGGAGGQSLCGRDGAAGGEVSLERSSRGEHALVGGAKGGAPGGPGSVCRPGASGAPGADGLPGESGFGFGDLRVDGTFVGLSGTGGLAGLPGGGGAGGGSFFGAFRLSGGGGGAGSCPGAPAEGGGYGGASIAVLSIRTVLTTDDATFRALGGGNGGAGGLPALTQDPPALGGSGVLDKLWPDSFSCGGGAGGRAGESGAAGGGAGGPSIGLAYVGVTPVLKAIELEVGPGGAGGAVLASVSSASDGEGLAIKRFDELGSAEEP